VKVYARKIDAGDEADVKNLVDEVLEKHGRLDIFFANAGITAGMDRILDASADNFMKTMRTNALR
jgi:NAD(P)-dependent dehydrogenase (short-subunit alcohol dehydrogenase family)